MFLRGCVKPCTRCHYRHAPEALSISRRRRRRRRGPRRSSLSLYALIPTLYVVPLFASETTPYSIPQAVWIEKTPHGVAVVTRRLDLM